MKILSRALRLTAAVLAAFPLGASAQGAYPEDTVTLVAPFPPGGRTDLTTRSIAENFEEHLGTTVTVVNKSGAGGVIGAKHVANAAPDGYTLGVFSSAVISAQYTVETSTDLNDYEVCALVETSPAAVAVKADATWNSLRELVDYAKENPGELQLGMIPGASAQVFAGGLVDAADVEMTMVPFKGDAPGVTALAGGHIDVHVAVPASYKAMSEAGKIKILAVAAQERLPQLPDTPTFSEQGVDLVIGSFHACFAPKGTPDNVIETIEAALKKTMDEESTVSKMEKIGLGPTFMPSEEAADFIAKQDATFQRLIKDLGMMHESKM